MIRINRTARLIPLLFLAGFGLVAVGVPASQGGDVFVAGGRSTRPVDLPPARAERAKAHGRQLAAALGMPGVSQHAERLDDRFEHRTYDEVTSLDASGHEVAVARFEPDGKVAMALVLGWHPGRGASIDRTAVETRAAGFVRAAGLSAAGRPRVRTSAGAGGWSIDWPRVVDGSPVRGDGLHVALWADGSFHGLSRMERPLAARPARLLVAGIARTSAETWAGGRYGAAANDLRIGSVQRAWVAPNDTFAPAGPDAPAETLRLAWVVRFHASGALAERLRSLEVWLDAGDGTILGGDIAE
jgi:hypothetical protein